MPVYVYRNLKTGETFEVEQRMVEPALVADPVSGDPVKRLIQPVGIAFKGSGFYVTDSRSGKDKRSATTSPNGKDAPGEAKADAGSASVKSDGGASDKPVPSTTSTPAPKATAASGGAAD